ncbi:type 1 glutamine amidotransferase domain-containing protein [Marinobacter sp.]|uniref:type 1 glutamine amidotransferase domain-containing protein n=1 Tax=Marinobacter sp. TaxID=50741 RepID=UPI00384FBF69
MKILMVLTSHSEMGDTGHKTGFWLEEFTAPWYVFRDAGAEVILASPAGGQPPIDPNSEAEDAQTETTRRFHEDREANEALANTTMLTEVPIDAYDAVFFPGGHGPLWDLAGDPAVIALIEDAVNRDMVVAAVCHAPGVFRHPRNGSGASLVSGRKVTGFSNSEEEAVGLTGVVPFLVEDMLKNHGGHYSKGDDWAPYVVTDGRLITGQNPASSAATAEAVLDAMKH